MSSALNERKAEIQRGLAALCDAIGSLAAVRDALAAQAASTAPGSECEGEHLKLHRVCEHLVEAAADLPEGCWGLLLERSIGGEEFKARMHGIVAGKAVAA
jgi:hypothetical protein